MPRPHCAQGRILPGTHRTMPANGTARVKGTAGRQLGGRRGLADDGHEACIHRINTGNAAQQTNGVGMARMLEDGLHRTGLNNPPAVHHSHVVCHLCHHTQIMGDQDNGRARIRLPLGQDREHLRLHGHIQCRGGFVRNDELGTP